MDELNAQRLLLKCTGVEIWDLETCRRYGIPEDWIDELKDCFESGFDRDANTIYVHDQVVNQYEGIHDLQLAYKLAELLNIDWQRATASVISREAQVRALQDELDEL